MLNYTNRTLKQLTMGGILASLALATAVAYSAQGQKLGYSDTPMLPGGKWHVHDGDRPQPKVITPGTASTQEVPGTAPSDAIVLFDGKDTSHWRDSRGGETKWLVEGGNLVSVRGAGYVFSKEKFGDCQLHVEFACPLPAEGTSQGRGNSGVFFHDDIYEIQVLDCFNNKTYPDGQTAALYGQYPPLVNACRPPGQFQTYDIFWTAPKFEGEKLISPAYCTVVHNGVLVHNHTEVMGPMIHRTFPKYRPHPPKGSIAFQDHGNPVRFRNVWVREIKGYDQP